MSTKPAISREERLERARKDELARQSGMEDYLKSQEAVDANTTRLRALRLAREAEQAAAAEAKPAPAKKKPSIRRGIGSK